jgi:hypothetical protein
MRSWLIVRISDTPSTSTPIVSSCIGYQYRMTSGRLGRCEAKPGYEIDDRRHCTTQIDDTAHQFRRMCTGVAGAQTRFSPTTITPTQNSWVPTKNTIILRFIALSVLLVRASAFHPSFIVPSLANALKTLPSLRHRRRRSRAWPRVRS